jgi:cell division protein FtsI (penicillin-binding protein 3)
MRAPTESIPGMPASRRSRWMMVFAVASLWMLAVLFRLVWLQLFSYGKYLARAERQQERVLEINPARGVIYDRNGHELAVSTPIDSCFVDPAEISDPSMMAHLLAPILGMAEESILVKLSHSSKTFVWLARKLPPEISQRIRNLNMRGVYLQKESERYYPQGPLAAHVLGYVDTDEHGLGGIEYAFDKEVRGRPGRMLVMEDANGRWFDRRVTAPEPGESIVLTIDQTITYVAERELAMAMEASHAKSGVAVVQNPTNGEIYAIVNSPGFDPNKAGSAAADSRMNRAIAAAYEPGSTMKVMTLAGAIEDGVAHPQDNVDCQMGKIVVAGRLIHDWHPFGMLTVAGILAHSSDVGTIKVALKLGAARFDHYAQAFGFGQDTGIELPGENHGLLRPLERWNASSIGSLAMGQEVSVTPVQLTSAISAIANGGMLYRPRIIREFKHGSAEETPARPPAVRVISETTAATMRQMMEGVVLEGTGRPAQIPGYTTAGKSGTAQKIDPTTGRYSPNQYIASFVGYAPLNNPAVTILVVLDSPVGVHHGGDVAGPVFRRIAEQILPYLGVARDLPLPQQPMQAKNKSHEPEVTEAEDVAQVEQLNDAVPADAPPSPRVVGPQAPAPTVEVDNAHAVEVPSLLGDSVRSATEACAGAGLVPVLVGSGIAVEQNPAPGARLARGGRVMVRFARTARLVPAAAGGSK